MTSARGAPANEWKMRVLGPRFGLTSDVDQWSIKFGLWSTELGLGWVEIMGICEILEFGILDWTWRPCARTKMSSVERTTQNWITVETGVTN